MKIIRMVKSRIGLMYSFSTLAVCLALILSALVPCKIISQAAERSRPPFKYVWATAYHILPETHNNESGYFSLCEGLNGRIYVGAAKYGVNSYVVEFDPRTEQQTVVIDTHKVCGLPLTATGYAAQAKIHTRNFVGPSGIVYVGSKQGYRFDKNDTSNYAGGYVMTYNPRTGQAENLGMPLKGQGVIDVVADEKRGLIYVVTCEDQHWMLYEMKSKAYREIGPMLTPYATTLVDKRGRANAITKDFQLANYDPATAKTVTREIMLDGKKWTRANDHAIPMWTLAADGRSVYLTLLNDPTMIFFDLLRGGDTVTAKSYGKIIVGVNPDSRAGLTVSPDGKIYALYRVANKTGFGEKEIGDLQHLIRFDPKTNTSEDLGVIGVKNPGYFDFSPGPDGKPKPFTEGMPKLPDGVMTPRHVNMALIATRDGTLYATMLSPFTLLKIEMFRAPSEPDVPAQAR